MHDPFQITPHSLNRIKILALTWQFQNSALLSFDPFPGAFTVIFGSLSCCMVHIPFSFNFFDRWSQIFLKHPLVQ